MKKYLKLSSLVLGLVLSAGSVAKADGMGGGFREGFYAGADVSFARLHGAHGGTADFSVNGSPVSDVTGHTPNSSKMGGAIHGGYMMFVEDTAFVIGIEPYFGITPVREELRVSNIESSPTPGVISSTVIQKLEQRFNLGVPLKFGYMVTDDLFLYALVGLELGHFKHELEITDDTNNASEKHPSKNKLFKGISYGMGVSTDIDDFRIGIEAKNVNYKREKITTSYLNSTVVQGESITRFSPSVFSISAKVSYLF